MFARKRAKNDITIAYARAAVQLQELQQLIQQQHIPLPPMVARAAPAPKAPKALQAVLAAGPATGRILAAPVPVVDPTAPAWSHHASWLVWAWRQLPLVWQQVSLIAMMIGLLHAPGVWMRMAFSSFGSECYATGKHMLLYPLTAWLTAPMWSCQWPQWTPQPTVPSRVS